MGKAPTPSKYVLVGGYSYCQQSSIPLMLLARSFCYSSQLCQLLLLALGCAAFELESLRS